MSQKMSAPKLKKWMQANSVWQKDLFKELVKLEITGPRGIEHITQDQYDEIKRAVTVARVEEINDQMSRERNDQLLSRFERLWRQASGIPKPSAMSRSSGRGRGRGRGRGGRGRGRGRGGGRASRGAATESAPAKSAPNLKRFMQSNKVWNTDLYRQLIAMGVEGESGIANLTETDHDEIVRVVRIARVDDINDTASRRRTDELLARFEKIWRRRSGIARPTALGSVDDSKRAESPAPSRPSGSPKLKRWLQANECWNLDLYRALLAAGITDPEQIAGISESGFEALERAVAVARVQENNDQGGRDRAERMMATFEKKWRQRSGIRKSALAST